MPFFWRRLRENLVLFFGMGLLYTIIYHFATIPDATYAVTISYAGALILAFFAHLYFLHSYLLNVGDLKSYMLVNVAAYLVYVVIYYVIYLINECVGGWFRTVYWIFLMPYDVFVIWGAKTWLSAAIVHIIYLISVALMPFTLRESSDPLEEYFSANDGQ